MPTETPERLTKFCDEVRRQNLPKNIMSSFVLKHPKIYRLVIDHKLSVQQIIKAESMLKMKVKKPMDMPAPPMRPRKKKGPESAEKQPEFSMPAPRAQLVKRKRKNSGSLFSLPSSVNINYRARLRATNNSRTNLLSARAPSEREDSEADLSNLLVSDSFSEMIPNTARKSLREPSLVGKSTPGRLKKKRMAKLLNKKETPTMNLKDIACEDELSTLSQIFGNGGDSMTQGPSSIRRKLFDDELSCFSGKSSVRSKRSAVGGKTSRRRLKLL